VITKSDIQLEVAKVIQSRRLAGVGISMGMGKTLIGLNHMASNYTDYSKFLVTAPKRSIFNTWLAEAKLYHLDYLIDHIKFTTYLSLPKQSLSYDILYLDECHSLLYSHEPWLKSFLNDSNTKILGLTGTPPRHLDSEKGKMVSTFCPMVYIYEPDDAIKDKILNNYQIIIHPISLDSKKNLKVEKNGKVWFTSELDSYNYWSDRLENATTRKEEHIMRIMRMKALMDFPSKERYAKKIFNNVTNKCIIFANTQAQADRLCINSYHSNNPVSDHNLENFKQGKIKKLSAVLQLNEGINIPDLRTAVILHSYGNERKSKQRIGRMLRLNANETSTIHILYYENTVDKEWLNSALEDFDNTKIKLTCQQQQ